jgi:GTP-binding protein HflX
MTVREERRPKTERAVVVAVDLGDHRNPIGAELAEFEALIEAAGAEIVDEVVQKRAQVDPATLVGSGKVKEIVERVRERGATGLFVLNDLRPRQRTNLEKAVDLPVIDRTTVILDIFAQHARSREGKLQVELAQLRHRQANLIGANSALSRLGGGIGTRGPGETKLEVDRRKIGRRISVLRRALDDVRKQRANRRAGRSNERLVALVGYTNVGKSSLLNRLARANGRGAYVADRPFATLDPTLRRVHLSGDRSVRVVDTVGFINALPAELINAFRATLEELEDADLLVHVLDASSLDWERQRRSVEAILHELGLGEKPVVLALNKSDLVADPPAVPEAIPISAKTGSGIALLKAEIERRIA